MQDSKKCSGCKLDLPRSEFNVRNGTPSGLTSNCKSCRSEKGRSYRSANVEALKLKKKLHYKKNRLKILAKKQIYNSQNSEARLEYQRRWYATNKTNSEFKDKRHAQYLNEKSNLNRRLVINLRSRLNKAIRKSQRTGSAVSDLGCSIAEFKAYIALKFQPGMTWENWGRETWHLDHVRPLSSFDLTIPEQLKAAVHYTNLQPLWASDNLKKDHPRRETPTIYFIFGTFGSGKTTLVNSLNYPRSYSYDKFHRHPWELLFNGTSPVVYESPVLVAKFLREASAVTKVVPVFLDVPLDEIVKRLTERGKRVNPVRIEARIKRLKRIASRAGAISPEQFLKIAVQFT